MEQNNEKEVHYPALRQYDNQDFDRFERSKDKKQHNIMMLVGNGFDIAVLNHLGSKYTTDYKSFFYYLKSIKFNNNNILFRKMDELRIRDEQAKDESKRFPNWSDFELILEGFVSTPTNDYALKGRLERDLKEIQYEFSNFLNFVVSPDLLGGLDEKSSKFKWGYRTYSNFVADLDKEEYKKFRFSSERVDDHYHVFNFNVINFNYTALLDNYLHLDREQLEPHPSGTVDTNFMFRRNPRNYENYDSGKYPDSETGCSGYLVSDIHHPHGIQQIPRSLLFGIDGSALERMQTSMWSSFFATQFEKIFWAQTSLRYEKAILETELFIIFGSSRGETDRWWWKHILLAIFRGEAELIIYQYCQDVSFLHDLKEAKKLIKEKFINENFDSDLTGINLGEVFNEICDRIFVVIYSDASTISAFGFCGNCFSPYDKDPAGIEDVR